MVGPFSSSQSHPYDLISGAKTPWSTHRLQGLLDLLVESSALDGDDVGRGVWVVGDGRAALAAEDAVDVLPRGALTGPALGGPGDGQLVLEDDADEGYRQNAVSLAYDALQPFRHGPPVSQDKRSRSYSRSSRIDVDMHHNGDSAVSIPV